MEVRILKTLVEEFAEFAGAFISRIVSKITWGSGFGYFLGEDSRRCLCITCRSPVGHIGRIEFVKVFEVCSESKVERFGPRAITG